jgi:hypothetical protein
MKTPDTPLFAKTHDFNLWLLRHTQRFLLFFWRRFDDLGVGLVLNGPWPDGSMNRTLANLEVRHHVENPLRRLAHPSRWNSLTTDLEEACLALLCRIGLAPPSLRKLLGVLHVFRR